MEILLSLSLKHHMPKGSRSPVPFLLTLLDTGAPGMWHRLLPPTGFLLQSRLHYLGQLCHTQTERRDLLGVSSLTAWLLSVGWLTSSRTQYARCHVVTRAVASKDVTPAIYTAECQEGKSPCPEKQRRVLKWKEYFFINGSVFLTPHLKDIFTITIIK